MHNIHKIRLDFILIQFGLVLNGTWCDGRRNALMGNDPEKVSNVQKTNQRATNKNRKEGLRSYADMTIYPLDPARLVCCHKLPTTVVTSRTLSNV